MEEGEVDDSLCASCGENRFKYRCPHCDSGKTCSLACSVAHKKSCQRTNHATRFVPLEKYDMTQLGRDQSFLSSLESTVSSANKKNEELNMKPNKFNWIKCAGRKGIQVTLLPSHFSEHKKNKTKRLPNDSLEWTVEIRSGERNFLLEGVSDKRILAEILNQTVGSIDYNTVELKTYDDKMQTNWTEITDISNSLEMVLKGKKIIEFPKFRLTTRQEKTQE